MCSCVLAPLRDLVGLLSCLPVKMAFCPSSQWRLLMKWVWMGCTHSVGCDDLAFGNGDIPPVFIWSHLLPNLCEPSWTTQAERTELSERFMAAEKGNNFFSSKALRICYSQMHKLTDSLGQICLLVDTCSPFLELINGRTENKPVASRSTQGCAAFLFFTSEPDGWVQNTACMISLEETAR